MLQKSLVYNSPVMVGTTSQTTTTRVLAMLSYTTVTRRYVSAVLASLAESCRHGLQNEVMSVLSSIDRVHPTPNCD